MAIASCLLDRSYWLVPIGPWLLHPVFLVHLVGEYQDQRSVWLDILRWMRLWMWSIKFELAFVFFSKQYHEDVVLHGAWLFLYYCHGGQCIAEIY